MRLILQRRIDTGKQTLGTLFIKGDKNRVCYTLEDTYRPKKIMHKTRIPANTYALKLRTYGSHYKRYIEKFPELNHNRGMIQVMQVDGFTDILIHIGNRETDTSGCLLVGMDYVEDDGEVRLVNSTVAYKKLYGIVADVLEKGTDCTIEIIDEKEIDIEEIDDMIKGCDL
jgi:hypothetical protein